MFKWSGGPRKSFPKVVYNTSSYIKKSVYSNVVAVYLYIHMHMYIFCLQQMGQQRCFITYHIQSRTSGVLG